MHRRLTLTELAQRAGLPLPTAHRLAGELLTGSALERSATDPGHYVIGRRLWDLGRLAPIRTGLRLGGCSVAVPIRQEDAVVAALQVAAEGISRSLR